MVRIHAGEPHLLFLQIRSSFALIVLIREGMDFKMESMIVVIRQGEVSALPADTLAHCCLGGRNSSPTLEAASSNLPMNSPVMGGIAAERSSTG